MEACLHSRLQILLKIIALSSILKADYYSVRKGSWVESDSDIPLPGFDLNTAAMKIASIAGL